MTDGRRSVSKCKLVGQVAFVFHPVRAWEQCVVLSVDESDAGEVAIARLRSGEILEVPVIADSLFLPSVSGSVDSFPDDLLQLPELHDALLLNALRVRHARDLTYMHIGEIILSVNPFKTIPAYMDKCMQAYLDHLDTAQLPSGLPPHVWGVAHRAYVEMRLRQLNYSIVASGESGSGKTEACKKMLKYLCAASERVATDESVSHRLRCISEKVQMSSVILESFGNAKTVKNDNSSRFGKFMEVQFDTNGVMVGLRVTPFLLERSRAITCGNDERVYHVFYQLVAGANKVLRDALRIGNPRDFVLLNKGGCVSLKSSGVDDAKDFQFLQKALVSIGFSDEEQSAMWSVVGSVLHMQNIVFELRKIDDSAYLSEGDIEIATFVAAHLLQLPQSKSFVECLTASTVVIGEEHLTRKFSVQKAKDQRDSICKFLYSKLFLFLVHKINAATACGAHQNDLNVSTTSVGGDSSLSESAPATWIGLLDIFGFEDLQVNSLEQFCINLANEALQRQYAEKMFLTDAEEMRTEGVEPNITDFIDNQLCLVLLQGSKNSIISFLDDASLLDVERSRTNPDFVFLNTITSAFRPDYQTAPGKTTRSVLGRNAKMDSPSTYFYRGRLDDNNFTIRHYAGDAKYCVNNFVEKNNDIVKDSCAQVLQGTTSWTLQEMMGTTEEMVGLLGDVDSPSSPLSNSRGSKRTVASTFRTSLRLLTEMLNSSACNWVRCIRPHSRRQSGLFDGKLVLEQLVATGVLSTINQRQKNYPFRPQCNEFLHHYRVILRSRHSYWSRMTLKERCSALLMEAGTEARSAQVGNTRVFLTTEAHRLLEYKRLQRSEEMVEIVKRYIAAFLSRMHTRAVLLTRYALSMQRLWRITLRIRRCVQQYYEELRRKRNERFLEVMKSLLRWEARSRLEFLGEHDSYIRTLWREFRTQLVPLVSDVLRNVRAVEAKQREVVSLKAFSCYSVFCETFVREAAVALEREKQRINAKLELDARKRAEMLDSAVKMLKTVVEEEQSAYEALQSGIIAPCMKKLKAQANVIRRLNQWRDESLRELNDAKVAEERRLAVEEVEKTQSEEEKWRCLVGEEQYLKEMRYFQSFSADPYSTPPPLRAFLRNGIPSKVLQTPIYSNCPAFASIGAVSSFYDYREYIRSEFSRACTNGTVPSLHVHQHHDGALCKLCNFLSYPSHLGVPAKQLDPSPSTHGVSRRLYEENSDSDDSFDELNY
ncbi:myosin heavy chain [Trypanosoma grayi]|uniref:myosin heavy chain n=1 Tax=Trypanosoma grayi TaxID=71804 RepID=UPI0004F3FF2F|nr:myosin heavy chain [Trypanosoma grayi]KEG12919.1 myosin heavy chain [Trypanosoma grayi]